MHQFDCGHFGCLAVDDDGCAGGAGDVARAVHDGDIRYIGVGFTLFAQGLQNLSRPFSIYRHNGREFDGFQLTVWAAT